jgi:hypothetical protein
VKLLAGWSLRSLDLAHADLEDAFFSAYDAPDPDSADPGTPHPDTTGAS